MSNEAYRQDIRTKPAMCKNLNFGQQREKDCMIKFANTLNANEDVKYKITYKELTGMKYNKNHRDNGDFEIKVCSLSDAKKCEFVTDIKANDKGNMFRFKLDDLNKAYTRNWIIIYFHLEEGTLNGKFRFFFPPEIEEFLSQEPESIYQFGGRPGYTLSVDDYIDWMDTETLMSKNGLRTIHARMKTIINNCS